jgi:hypothetical protein
LRGQSENSASSYTSLTNSTASLGFGSSRSAKLAVVYRPSARCGRSFAHLQRLQTWTRDRMLQGLSHLNFYMPECIARTSNSGWMGTSQGREDRAELIWYRGDKAGQGSPCLGRADVRDGCRSDTIRGVNQLSNPADQFTPYVAGQRVPSRQPPYLPRRASGIGECR